MIEQEAIRTAIYEFLEDLRPGILSSDDPLRDDSRLGIFIDSFDMLNLVAFLGKTFDVQVEDSDYTGANFGTINAIVNYVSRKQVATPKLR